MTVTLLPLLSRVRLNLSPALIVVGRDGDSILTTSAVYVPATLLELSIFTKLEPASLLNFNSLMVAAL